MPRSARLDAPGTLHHVMIRGIDRRAIFRGEEDRHNFVVRLGNLAKDMSTEIVAWALLNNHVHLLLFSGPSGLPLFMRRLLTGYAQAFNRRHGRQGHLFQNRYKSIVCDEDSYLLELVRYIHLNPLRARVVKNLKELADYPWSGHTVLLGRAHNDWQQKEFVFGQFPGNERDAIRAYERFVEEAKDQGRRPELVGGGLARSVGGWSEVLSLRGKGEHVPSDPRILGGGDFVSNILAEAEQRVKRFIPLKRTSIGDIIKERCQQEGVSEKELRGGGRRRRVSELRAEIAFDLAQGHGISLAEIARQLGVCTSAIAKAVRKNE